MNHLLKVIQFFKTLKSSDILAVEWLIKMTESTYINKISKQLSMEDLIFNQHENIKEQINCLYCFENIYEASTPPIIIKLNNEYFYIKPAKKETLQSHIEISNMSHTKGIFDIFILLEILSFFPSFMIIYNDSLHYHFDLGLIDAPILKKDASIIFSNIYLLDWPLESYLIKENELDDLIDEFNNLYKRIENKSKSFLFFKRGNKFHLYIIIHNNSITPFEAIGLFDINNNFPVKENYINSIDKLKSGK